MAVQAPMSCAEQACARIERLHEEYASPLQRYCARRLRSREDAEDAVQLVFLIAYRRLAEGVEPRFERAWLFRIAQSVVYGRRRALSRRARVEAPVGLELIAEYTAAPSREPPPELLNLPSALAGMSEQQRRALVLREWKGLSYNEVAAELGVSTPTVENLLTRARRNLAQQLEGAGADAGRRLRSVLWLPVSGAKWAVASGAVSKTLAGAVSVAVVAFAAQHRATLMSLLPSTAPSQGTASPHVSSPHRTSRPTAAVSHRVAAPLSHHVTTAKVAPRVKPKHPHPAPPPPAHGGVVPVQLEPDSGAVDNSPAATDTAGPPVPPSTAAAGGDTQSGDTQNQGAGSADPPAAGGGAPAGSTGGNPTQHGQKPDVPPGQAGRGPCTPLHDLPSQAQGSPGCPGNATDSASRQLTSQAAQLVPLAP